MRKFEEKEKYTYADYLTWPDEFRCEIINGRIWDMSAAPRRSHQELLTSLFGNLYNFLEDKPCRLYVAPFDVSFPEASEDSEEETETVVQPDLVVICDESKLNDKGCKGAPDFVVEILSPPVAWASSKLACVQPSTSWKDETEKLKLYEKHGVKEYWIINPDSSDVNIYVLKDGYFEKAESLYKKGIIKSHVLKGFEISLEDLIPSGAS